MDSHEAGDHHFLKVLLRLRHKSDRAGAVLDPLPDPLRACLGLAETAPGQGQPCLPFAVRGDLIGPSPEPPVVEKFPRLRLSEACEYRLPLGFR